MTTDEIALKLAELEVQLRCAELKSNSKPFDDRSIDIYNEYLKEIRD